MIIDGYAHMYPKAYLKAVLDVCKVPTIEFHLRSDRFYDPDSRAKILEKFGVATQVVNIAGGLPLREAHSPQEKAITNSPQLARLANDVAAKIVAKKPEHLVGVATLPLNDIPAALDELDRCVKELSLKGICIQTSDIPESLDSHLLDPIYERMSKYDDRMSLPLL